MTSSASKIQACQIKIPLLPGVKILVEKGDEVDREKVLAANPEEIKEFNLVKILRISPQELEGCFLVSPGAEVKEDQVVFQKKSFLSKCQFKSPVNGKVIGLTPEGILQIEVKKRREITSPVKGEIKEIKEGDFLICEFKAAVLTASEGVGPVNWGELQILGEREQEAGLDDLPEEVKEKILIFGGKVSPGLIHKAEALDVAGIFAGSLRTPVRVQELVVLTAGGEDGFIPEALWVDLLNYQGKKALISGEEKKLEIPL